MLDLKRERTFIDSTLGLREVRRPGILGKGAGFPWDQEEADKGDGRGETNKASALSFEYATVSFLCQQAGYRTRILIICFVLSVGFLYLPYVVDNWQTS